MFCHTTKCGRTSQRPAAASASAAAATANRCELQHRPRGIGTYLRWRPGNTNVFFLWRAPGMAGLQAWSPHSVPRRMGALFTLSLPRWYAVTRTIQAQWFQNACPSSVCLLACVSACEHVLCSVSCWQTNSCSLLLAAFMGESCILAVMSFK